MTWETQRKNAIPAWLVGMNPHELGINTAATLVNSGTNMHVISKRGKRGKSKDCKD
jgi:hypothetical protein